jgi:hypothetical protein
MKSLLGFRRGKVGYAGVCCMSYALRRPNLLNESGVREEGNKTKEAVYVCVLYERVGSARKLSSLMHSCSQKRRGCIWILEI